MQDIETKAFSIIREGKHYKSVIYTILKDKIVDITVTQSNLLAYTRSKLDMNVDKYVRELKKASTLSLAAVENPVTAVKPSVVPKKQVSKTLKALKKSLKPVKESVSKKA